MSKIKNLISNLYNRYMDEMNDYEELEDEYVENDLEEEAEYRAKRSERERRLQIEDEYAEEGTSELVEPVRNQMAYDGMIVTSKANLYDYKKEGKVCCHCDSSLEKGILSEKDQWGMSYTICPTCQFVNRIDPTGEPVYPSSDIAEMEHALELFAKKGHVFKGFNTKEEDEVKRVASL